MISRLILGTVQLGIPYGINNKSGKPALEEAHEILEMAAKSGITTLDTANAYGNATEVIGLYHQTGAQKFKVISKFHAGSTDIKNDIHNELAKLNITHFEGYLFHAFADFENASSGIIQALKELKHEGLINKVGVSVYDNAQFEKAILSAIVDLIQFPYNLLDNFYQRGELMQRAKQAGKELHIRSVFLQGLFFMDPDKLPAKLNALVPYLQKLRQIAAENNLTMQEMALYYALGEKLVDKVLIGVDSAEQLKSNLKAIEKTAVINEAFMNSINAIHVKEKELLSPANWK